MALNSAVMNRLSLEKYEVLWMANDTIFKQKKEITSQLWSMVGERLGKGQAYGAARFVRHFFPKARMPLCGITVFWLTPQSKIH